MIQVTADHIEKTAKTLLKGRTDELLYEFAMIVRSLSNGLISAQPEDMQNAMRGILAGLAQSAIEGDAFKDFSEVTFNAPNN